MYSNDQQIVGGLIMLVILALYWIIPSIVCAVAAKQKGLNWVGFGLFALLFTPIVGFLAVIAFPPKVDAEIVMTKRISE